MSEQPFLEEEIQDRCNQIQVKVTLLSGNNSDLRVRAWLASKETHGEKQDLSSGSAATVEIQVSQLEVLEYLVLIVEVKTHEDRFLGELRLSYKAIKVKPSEATVAIGGPEVSVMAEVVENNFDSKRLSRRASAISTITLNDRQVFLDKLAELAVDPKFLWRTIGRFHKYFVPSLQITRDAFEVMSQKMWMKGHVDNLVAGPGIVYTLHMLLVMFAFYCLVLWLFGFYLLPGCLRESVKVTGVCLFPITFYSIYVVGALGKLYYEAAVMGGILPPKVMIGGVPSFPGFDWLFGKSPTSFKIKGWLLIKVIASAATSLDIFSGSIFLARVSATRYLTKDDHWTMEDAWLRSLQHSPFFSVFNGLGYPSFLLMVWVTWASVFVELLFALAYSLPLSEELQSSKRKEQMVWFDFRPPVDRHKLYVRKKFIHSHTICGGDKFTDSPELCDNFVDYAEYGTLFVRRQVHGRALVALLKVGRMSLALANDTEYVTEVVRNWKPKEIANYQQQLSGFFTVFMVQRLLTTSLQASFVGITKNLTHDTDGQHIDWISFMNVMLGCGMGFSTIFDEVRLSGKMMLRVFHRAKETLEGTASKLDKWHAKNDRIWSCVTFLYTMLFAIFSILWLIYCVLKAIRVNQCECGLWNINLPSLFTFYTSLDSIGYCVDFEPSSCQMNEHWINETRPMQINPFMERMHFDVIVPGYICLALGFPTYNESSGS